MVSSMKASPGPARPGAPWPFSRSVWPSCGALGDGDVDGAAVGEGDALLAAADGVLQVDLEPGAHVGAALGEAAEAAAAPPRAAAAAPPPNISPRMSPRSTPSKLSLVGRRPAAAASRRPGRAPQGPCRRRRSRARSRARRRRSRRRRTSCACRRRPGCRRRALTRLKRSSAALLLGIGVGVVLLGELAERLADLVRARAAGDAQLLIGVARQDFSPSIDP